MFNRHILYLLPLFLATGCNKSADRAPDTHLQMEAQASSPPQPPQEGYDWKLSIDKEGEDRRAFLFYAEGSQDSDQAQLKFMCIQGEGNVYAGVTVKDEYDALELKSNNQTLTLKVSSNGSWLTSEAFPIQSPWMKAFSQSGGLTMMVSTNTNGLGSAFMVDAASSTPQGLRAITDFSKHCSPNKGPVLESVVR